jgi:hypothetical protein
MNLTVRVQAGSYVDSIPLATLSETKDSKGYAATRQVTHDSRLLPWFLVRPGSGVKLTVALAGSESESSGGASAALGVALGAIQAVSPTASVVTSLSANSTRTRAQAIDTALTSLFSRKLSEGHAHDPDLAHWDGRPVLRLKFRVPTKSDDWTDGLRLMGIWDIGLSAPKPSIFSDIFLCPARQADPKVVRCAPTLDEAADAVYREVLPDRVLAYPLLTTPDGVVSVRNFIQKQDAWTKSMTAFTGDAPADGHEADGLCSAIKAAAQDAGLNHVDAEIITWSMIHGMTFPKVLGGVGPFLGAPHCATGVAAAGNRHGLAMASPAGAVGPGAAPSPAAPAASAAGSTRKPQK